MTYFWRVTTLRPEREYSLPASELDTLVDKGYDYVVIVGPTFRLTSTVEDWLDFGDASDGNIILRTNRMERM